ncbi:hypothetical protein D3C87_1338020 [compost metagenome]
MFRLPWQAQAIIPSIRQADSITQAYLSLILTSTSGLCGQLIHFVQTKQLPGQFQQCFTLHLLNRVRHAIQSIAIEFQRFQLRKCPEEPI